MNAQHTRQSVRLLIVGQLVCHSSARTYTTSHKKRMKPLMELSPFTCADVNSVSVREWSPYMMLPGRANASTHSTPLYTSHWIIHSVWGFKTEQDVFQQEASCKRLLYFWHFIWKNKKCEICHRVTHMYFYYFLVKWKLKTISFRCDTFMCCKNCPTSRLVVNYRRANWLHSDSLSLYYIVRLTSYFSERKTRSCWRFVQGVVFPCFQSFSWTGCWLHALCVVLTWTVTSFVVLPTVIQHL